MIFVFDNTLEGLLSAVFAAVERKQPGIVLRHAGEQSIDMFQEVNGIATDSVRAARVWKGLRNRMPERYLKRLIYVFLAESEAAHQCLFNFIIKVFTENLRFANYADADALLMDKFYTKVRREKHRMKALVRFQQERNGMYFAPVEPDYNVLPLVVHFFSERYAGQPWIIFDMKRRYGYHYDRVSVTEITLQETGPETGNSAVAPQAVSESEGVYDAMWKLYFKSATIESRKNRKLQLRHVPMRYRKYLNEFNG